MATQSFSGSLSTSGGYSSSSVAYQGTYRGGSARTGRIVFSGLDSLSGATITAASISVSYGSAGAERYKDFGGLWTSSVIAYGNSETRTDSFILSDVRSAASGSGTITYTFTDPETTIDSGKSYTTNYGSITSATLSVTYSTLATYTISYDANGGSPTPSSQTKTQGTAINLTTTEPSKSDSSYSYSIKFYVDGSLNTTKYSDYTTSYTFYKWYYNGSYYSSGATFNVDANCTLTAEYTESSTSPSSITLPTAPSKSGYSFAGWYTSSSGGTRVGGSGSSYTPNSSTSLYAQYTADNIYTITYNANGGSGAPSTQSATKGSTIILSSTIPTKASETISVNCQVLFDYNGGSGNTSSLNNENVIAYTFKEWYTNASGTGGTAYLPGDSYTGSSSITLYAQWTSLESISGVVLPTATYKGYDFLGWYTEATGGTRIGGTGTKYFPEANITLYAHWEKTANKDPILSYYTNGDYVEVEVKYYTGGQFAPVAMIKRWVTDRWVTVGKDKPVFEIEYTGTYTTSDVTVDGVPCTLWTITGSGTLTVSDSVRYWMCGGGGKGGNAIRKQSSSSTGTYDTYSGGGGGGGYVSTGTVPGGVHVVTVGASVGASKISDITASPGSNGSKAKGGNGGSGGGAAAGYYTPFGGSTEVNAGTKGTGAGISTYPFGLTSLKAHCAGGGGGGAYLTYDWRYKGGAGGTNGDYGGSTVSQSDTSDCVGGTGGTYGGGNGGSATISTATAGSAASFYGGGGGGGGKSFMSERTPSGGLGYQGVVYILVPKS